jgi:hypothetical protein
MARHAGLKTGQHRAEFFEISGEIAKLAQSKWVAMRARIGRPAVLSLPGPCPPAVHLELPTQKLWIALESLPLIESGGTMLGYLGGLG